MKTINKLFFSIILMVLSVPSSEAQRTYSVNVFLDGASGFEDTLSAHCQAFMSYFGVSSSETVLVANSRRADFTERCRHTEPGWLTLETDFLASPNDSQILFRSGLRTHLPATSVEDPNGSIRLIIGPRISIKHADIEIALDTQRTEMPTALGLVVGFTPSDFRFESNVIVIEGVLDLPAVSSPIHVVLHYNVRPTQNVLDTSRIVDVSVDGVSLSPSLSSTFLQTFIETEISSKVARELESRLDDCLQQTAEMIAPSGEEPTVLSLRAFRINAEELIIVPNLGWFGDLEREVHLSAPVENITC